VNKIKLCTSIVERFVQAAIKISIFTPHLVYLSDAMISDGFKVFA
jgi:hypothetical protein